MPVEKFKIYYSGEKDINIVHQICQGGDVVFEDQIIWQSPIRQNTTRAITAQFARIYDRLRSNDFEFSRHVGESQISYVEWSREILNINEPFQLGDGS